MKKLLYSILGLSLLFSCSNDDDGTTTQEPLGDYENGIIVSAEGGPASVSYISIDFSTSENDICDQFVLDSNNFVPHPAQ